MRQMLVGAVIISLVSVPLFAADPAPAVLTLDRLFHAREFDEQRVGRIQWTTRQPAYHVFGPPAAAGEGRPLLRHDLVTGETHVIVPAEAFKLPDGAGTLSVESYQFSADESKLLIFTNSQRVWRQNTRGDYWVIDLVSRRLRRLGGDAAPATMLFAKFSPDGSRVAYVRENNIHVQNLDDLSITVLTADGSQTLINGTSDWVNEEELGIRDAFRWSPDGRLVAFWQFDTTGVGRFHLLNNTAGTYPRITSFPYPKVGETNSAVRLGVVAATGGPVRWLEIPGDPREHYVARMEWAPDGRQLMVQQFNRLQNINRVMLGDAATGAARTILTETDSAWLENDNPVRWLEEGAKFLWLSERDGWRHAYVADVNGQPLTRVTRGEFDVIEVDAVDEKNGWLYFAASAEDATKRYLYRARLGGGMPERLSPNHQPGWHTYDISPGADWAVHVYSTFTSPPVTELIRLPGHEVVKVLADNRELREKIDALRRPRAEFFQVDIGDAVLDGWCLRPPEFDPAATYPLLIHVYGEPHFQVVKDAWAGKRGLWHWMLAQQGYVVASVDNRGTIVPRGREWRKCIHRQIGILASREQAAATRILLERWPFVDRNRVGIWGWSGGGSMSLNAIFRYPDLYQTAIAVAPNAEQRLYDTIYQERYMGLPADNPEGYRLGSPITFARQLEGNLLLIHGTGDDNGHYQGTELLMDELIRHNKHFTVMPYPSRSHSISEGANTERHFYGLMTRYLRDNLPVEAERPEGR